MSVATPRPLSAADLNFNPARFPLGQLADFARAHWGVDGELTPLDGERDQNHRMKTADGASYVLSSAPLDKASFFRDAARSIQRRVTDRQTLELFRCAGLDLYSRPGETREQFEARADEAAQAAADADPDYARGTEVSVLADRPGLQARRFLDEQLRKERGLPPAD